MRPRMAAKELFNRKRTGVYRYKVVSKPVGWKVWPFLRKYENFLILQIEYSGTEYYDSYGRVESEDVLLYREADFADAKNFGFEELWLEVYSKDPRGANPNG